MTRRVLAAAAVLAAPVLAKAGAAEAALGPDAAACAPGSGRPALLVTVTGFEALRGRVRIQAYNQSNFLVRGQRVRRIDLPVTGAAMPICVALPAPGTYAVGVRHDVNGDNQRRDWTDGAGFSRNPKLSLVHLKPSFSEVAVTVGPGPKPVQVVLLYRHGLTIGRAR
jgi:uncharacterized protein (DUF2141 family)